MIALGVGMRVRVHHDGGRCMMIVENCGKQEKEKKEKNSTSKHEHRLKANGTAEENRLGTESCDRKNTDPSNKGNGINTWADVVRKHTPQEKD